MIRQALTLLLVLLLVTTSQSMAVARGSAAAVGQMVICTGSGPVAVFLDAEGRPTNAPHLCPDSTLVAPGVAAGQAAPRVARLRVHVPGPQAAASAAPIRPRALPPSRAPPVHFRA